MALALASQVLYGVNLALVRTDANIDLDRVGAPLWIWIVIADRKPASDDKIDIQTYHFTIKALLNHGNPARQPALPGFGLSIDRAFPVNVLKQGPQSSWHRHLAVSI